MRRDGSLALLPRWLVIKYCLAVKALQRDPILWQAWNLKQYHWLTWFYYESLSLAFSVMIFFLAFVRQTCIIYQWKRAADCIRHRYLNYFYFFMQLPIQLVLVHESVNLPMASTPRWVHVLLDWKCSFAILTCNALCWEHVMSASVLTMNILAIIL